MSFTIKCYQNLSENNVVDKYISQVGSDLEGNLKDNCSIIDPVIMIQGIPGDNIAKLNYIYIPSFSRYYYVNNIEIENTNLFILHCHVDVLMTYKAGIRSNSAVIARQENAYNLYLPDSAFKTYSNPHYQIVKFPSGFSGFHYVLTVAG